MDQSRFWLPTVSASFHGRDLFGPVAAHLARGASLDDVGTPTATMETIPFPAARLVRDGDGEMVSAEGEVIHVDRYGNVIASLTPSDLPFEPVVEVAGRRIVSPRTGAGVRRHFMNAAWAWVMARS